MVLTVDDLLDTLIGGLNSIVLARGRVVSTDVFLSGLTPLTSICVGNSGSGGLAASLDGLAEEVVSALLLKFPVGLLCETATEVHVG